MGCLPATVATKGSSVGSSVAAAATAATPTTTATATTTTPAATTATAVADHLGKTGINLLLGLGQDSNQVTGLLGVCGERVTS